MKGAAIFLCAITAVLGSSIEIDVELNSVGCPIDSTIEKFYPHSYCDMFYQCSNGLMIELRCSGGLLFNLELLECDWSYNVDCTNRTEPNPNYTLKPNDEDKEIDTTIYDDPAEAPEICAKAGSNGILVAHEICNRFYNCWDGEPTAQRCPPTLFYNPRKARCDFPENVDCGNRTIPDADEEWTTRNYDAEIDGPINDDPSKAAEICSQSGSNGVLVAHELCNRFFNCWDGTPVAQRCPPTLLYNPRKERCDFPENVACGNRTIPETDDEWTTKNYDAEIDGPINDDPSKAAEICAQDGSDGVLVAHELCNRFFNCWDGTPVAQRCPPSLLYNPRKERCDFSQNVNCGNRTIPETDDEWTTKNYDAEIDGPINDDPSKAAEICAQDGSNGVLVAHELCNRFFNCWDGTPVAQRCPPSLLYNPRKERCDFSANVDCGNRTIPETDDEWTTKNYDAEIDGPINDDPSKAAEVCAEENSNGRLVAHEICNRFFNCWDGKPVAQRCPPKLLYNPRKERCDWTVNVDCGNRTIPDADEEWTTKNYDAEIDGPINDDPSQAASICRQANSTGELVAHQNCDEFYICNLYAPVAVRCGPKLLYNPRKARCDWPDNVDCGDRVIPDRGSETTTIKEDSCINCDPSQASEICARSGSNGVLVAHENCNQYYSCYDGIPNVLSCLNTLLYNPWKGWCDWPETVDCGNRIIPDNQDSGNNNPSDASEICARWGSEGTMVAHETCSKFYKCSQRKPVELECQIGLVFNAIVGICDWPANVDCGERLV